MPEKCKATRERDFGSHRGGLMTMTCTLPAGHKYAHGDDEGHSWHDDTPETVQICREHEPKLCSNCECGSECMSTGATCNELLAAYDAGRSDFAAELGRTWPEELEGDLAPEDVICRVAELLEKEHRASKKG